MVETIFFMSEAPISGIGPIVQHFLDRALQIKIIYSRMNPTVVIMSGPFTTTTQHETR